MEPSIRIPRAEFETRTEKLRSAICEQRLAGAVLFDNYYITYYTDFAFIPTERPMALLISSEGERVLFVPRLELEHAQAEGVVDRVESYPEYPDDPHPMVRLKALVEGMAIAGRVGVDTDGYPWILGYQGPSLSELMGDPVRRIGATIEAQMMVKSPAEIALIRESAKWSHLAHRLLQRYTRPGANETRSLAARQPGGDAGTGRHAGAALPGTRLLLGRRVGRLSRADRETCRHPARAHDECSLPDRRRSGYRCLGDGMGLPG